MKMLWVHRALRATVAPMTAAVPALILAVIAAPGSSLAQSLDESLIAAYDSNPTLLAARAELRSVNEGVPQELSNYRPSVFADGSAGIQRINVSGTDGPENTNPLEAAVNAEQPLYRGGRTVAGVARAESEVAAQRAVLRSVEQGVLLGAVTAYMDVWRDQAVLQLTINNEQVLARQLEATQDRFDVGELTRTDVAQSEARLARATAQRIEAEGNLTASRAVFQEVVGFLPGTLEAPPALEGLPASEQDVVGAARDDNPAVLSARFAEQAARHQIDVSRGQLLPEAFLTGEARHSEETFSKDSETDLARGLVEVTVPLYQSGLVSSQVRESKQIAIQRSREIEESSRFAERVAIESWEDLETARAQIRSFESAVRSSEIALEGVRQENAVGQRTILDVLDAEQELLDAQVNLTRARRDEIVASYEVLSAMGRLTARNLELDVGLYDPLTDYRAVRNRWYGLEAPGAVE